MTNPIYSRQDDTIAPSIGTISIVGCGGVGTWTAIIGAMAGADELRLFDDDVLETHNLNRLPYTQDDVGEKKTELLKDRIKAMRESTVHVKTYGHATKVNLPLLKGHVFLCTDTRHSQNIVNEWCEQNGIDFTRVGYDGEHITVIPTVGSWGDDEGGYTVDTWIVPAVMAASIAIWNLVRARAERRVRPVDISSIPIEEIVKGVSRA